MANRVGALGEAIFETELRRHLASGEILFRPRHLGDKWPVVDVLVELTDVDDMNPFFLAQVKATASGYSADGARLRTSHISES